MALLFPIVSTYLGLNPVAAPLFPRLRPMARLQHQHVTNHLLAARDVTSSRIQSFAALYPNDPARKNDFLRNVLAHWKSAWTHPEEHAAREKCWHDAHEHKGFHAVKSSRCLAMERGGEIGRNVNHGMAAAARLGLQQQQKMAAGTLRSPRSTAFGRIFGNAGVGMGRLEGLATRRSAHTLAYDPTTGQFVDPSSVRQSGQEPFASQAFGRHRRSFASEYRPNAMSPWHHHHAWEELNPKSLGYSRYGHRSHSSAESPHQHPASGHPGASDGGQRHGRHHHGRHHHHHHGHRQRYYSADNCDSMWWQTARQHWQAWDVFRKDYANRHPGQCRLNHRHESGRGHEGSHSQSKSNKRTLTTENVEREMACRDWQTCTVLQRKFHHRHQHHFHAHHRHWQHQFFRSHAHTRGRTRADRHEECRTLWRRRKLFILSAFRTWSSRWAAFQHAQRSGRWRRHPNGRWYRYKSTFVGRVDLPREAAERGMAAAGRIGATRTVAAAFGPGSGSDLGRCREEMRASGGGARAFSTSARNNASPINSFGWSKEPTADDWRTGPFARGTDSEYGRHSDRESASSSTTGQSSNQSSSSSSAPGSSNFGSVWSEHQHDIRTSRSEDFAPKTGVLSSADSATHDGWEHSFNDDGARGEKGEWHEYGQRWRSHKREILRQRVPYHLAKFMTAGGPQPKSTSLQETVAKAAEWESGWRRTEEEETWEREEAKKREKEEAKESWKQHRQYIMMARGPEKAVQAMIAGQPQVPPNGFSAAPQATETAFFETNPPEPAPPDAGDNPHCFLSNWAHQFRQRRHAHSSRRRRKAETESDCDPGCVAKSVGVGLTVAMIARCAGKKMAENKQEAKGMGHAIDKYVHGVKNGARKKELGDLTQADLVGVGAAGMETMTGRQAMRTRMVSMALGRPTAGARGVRSARHYSTGKGRPSKAPASTPKAAVPTRKPGHSLLPATPFSTSLHRPIVTVSRNPVRACERAFSSLPIISALKASSTLRLMTPLSRLSLTLFPAIRTFAAWAGRSSAWWSAGMSASAAVLIVPFALVLAIWASGVEKTPVTGRLRALHLSKTEEEDLVSGLLAVGKKEETECQKKMGDVNDTEWEQVLRFVLGAGDADREGQDMLLGGKVIKREEDWRVEWVEATLAKLEDSMFDEKASTTPTPHEHFDVITALSMAQEARFGMLGDELSIQAGLVPTEARPIVPRGEVPIVPCRWKDGEGQVMVRGKKYGVIVVDRPDKNAFSFGFGPRAFSIGDKATEIRNEGVVVVFTGFLNDILKRDGETMRPIVDEKQIRTPPSPSETQTAWLSVLLAHELSHLVCDHTLENYAGFPSVVPHLERLVGDVVRTALFPLTAFFGPFVTDAVNNLLVSTGITRTSLNDGNLARLVGGCQSRTMELEADVVGLRLLANAQINPYHALNFWEDRLASRKGTGLVHHHHSHGAERMMHHSGRDEQVDLELTEKEWDLVRSHPVDEIRVGRIREELMKWASEGLRLRSSY